MAEELAQRRPTAILTADVVGYGGMMQRDEAGTLASLKARHQEILQPLVRRRSGRVVKLIGGGVLVEFGSALNAVVCAERAPASIQATADARAPSARFWFTEKSLRGQHFTWNGV